MRQILAGSAIIALAVACAAPAYAQETTSSISGAVTAGGRPVANATVTILDVASGTRSTATTNGAGIYSASGLRAGGPYTVTVSASGYEDYQVTDIATNVGQTFQLPITLESTGNEIVVTATHVRGAGNISQGPAMVLNASAIGKIASVNRDIRELAARDPFASEDSSQGNTRQISFAGVNPRFNRFTVDGVPITDSFGLNPDALPSRRGPVPLDSIGQFETKVAPYDIREGFFQGGVINAILKSGTNQFHGTGFYTYRSDSLQGDRTKDYISNATGRITVPKYTSKDFGATISGPIIKNRLFFMISAERVRASVPVPYGTQEKNAGNPISGLNQVDFDAITAAAKSKYGVDAGGILSNNGDKDDRIVGKIDANVSDTQRLSFTGIYTKDSILTPGTTASNQLSTESDDYTKPDRVLAGVVQLNSDWSSVFSTEARVLYKDYQSGQTPLLANTAQATVCADHAVTGAGGNSADGLTIGTGTSCTANKASVIVGPQGSSQANVLHVKTFGASLLARIALNDHRLRLLAEYQNVNNYDLFVNGANGTYYFDSIEAFQAAQAQTFSYTNATSLNPNDAAAQFTYQTYTMGIQDDWKVSSKLNISYGARYDTFGGHSSPLSNPYFFQREGFSNNEFINGKGLFQPRVGFDYAASHRLSIKGGAGIFGGGTPDVYVANSFSASGVQPASYTTSAAGSPYLNNVSLTTTPGGIQPLLRGSTTSSVSAIDPHFQIPSEYRATLSASYRANLGPLGDGWVFGADFLYTKTKDALLVQDYRNRPATGASALTPDGRQRYLDVLGTQADPNGDYVLTNTSKGRGYVAVVRFDKTWDMGININGSFTYQNVKDQQALTSSIASSNYNNGAYDDPNGGAYGHSNDEVKYAFKYDISYDHAFFGDYKTRIDLFGTTRIGSPYSYTFQDPTSSGSNRSSVFGTVGSNSHYLFYVPTGPNDPKVIYDSVATQNAIEAIINGSGLKNYRGKVAPRNAFNSKWFTKLDLHIEQQIPTFLGGSRITVFADVENFLNLLNRNWGQQLRSFFPYNKQVAQVACVAQGSNSCAQYKYSGAATASSLADQLVVANGSSLYTVRIGARFTF